LFNFRRKGQELTKDPGRVGADRGGIALDEGRRVMFWCHCKNCRGIVGIKSIIGRCDLMHA